MLWLESAAILKTFFPFQSGLISSFPFCKEQNQTEGVSNSRPGGSLEGADHFSLERSSMAYLSICNFPVWALEATPILV